MLGIFSVGVSFGLGSTDSLLTCLGLEGFLYQLVFWILCPLVLIGAVILVSLARLVRKRRLSFTAFVETAHSWASGLYRYDGATSWPVPSSRLAQLASVLESQLESLLDLGKSTRTAWSGSHRMWPAWNPAGSRPAPVYLYYS